MNGLDAIVLGASGGIGSAVSLQLASAGSRLTLVARRSDRLTILSRSIPDARVLSCDLASQDDVARLIHDVPDTDVLIDCTGAAKFSSLRVRSWAEIERECRVNILSPLQLIQHYGAGMAQRKRGWILTFGSTAAARPAPRFACYAAAKAFHRSLTRSLAAEWSELGVTVTCCVAGPTATDFAAKAGRMRSGGDDPVKVARSALSALKARKVICYSSPGARLREFLFRVIPDRALKQLSRDEFADET